MNRAVGKDVKIIVFIIVVWWNDKFVNENLAHIQKLPESKRSLACTASVDEEFDAEAMEGLLMWNEYRDWWVTK